jgi:hypothetical protein
MENTAALQPSRFMKIAIIQLYDDGRKDYGDLTGGVAKQYCEKFGYTYICYRERIEPHPHLEQTHRSETKPRSIRLGVLARC